MRCQRAFIDMRAPDGTTLAWHRPFGVASGDENVIAIRETRAQEIALKLFRYFELPRPDFEHDLRARTLLEAVQNHLGSSRPEENGALAQLRLDQLEKFRTRRECRELLARQWQEHGAVP